jgi:hypothetical protein
MPATDWKEVIPEDESVRFEGYAALLAKLQRMSAKEGATPARALHAKANLGVEAELEVLADIPAEAKVGMFAVPKRYRAVARFSNGAARRQSDRTMDVRGLAVKVFGVDGKKVIPGMEDATTQDFLAIRTSSLPIRDADEFMTVVRVGRPPALLPVRLMAALGPRRGLQVIRAALGGLRAPQAPLAATSYFSAVPIRYGDYAAQFAFAATETAPAMKIASATHLGDELAARLRERAVTYDLRIRFYADEKSTPIEDASVEWNTPWITVGRLVLPVQDPASPRGQKVSALVEELAFDPWHAREDLRPLGNIMRARNVAYRASTKARSAASEPREAPAFES